MGFINRLITGGPHLVEIPKWENIARFFGTRGAGSFFTSGQVVECDIHEEKAWMSPSHLFRPGKLWMMRW